MHYETLSLFLLWHKANIPHKTNVRCHLYLPGKTLSVENLLLIVHIRKYFTGALIHFSLTSSRNHLTNHIFVRIITVISMAVKRYLANIYSYSYLHNSSLKGYQVIIICVSQQWIKQAVKHMCVLCYSYCERHGSLPALFESENLLVTLP